MSDTRTLDDSLNESEKLINGKERNNDFWANENETFATQSEATTRVSNEDLLKESYHSPTQPSTC